MRRRTGPGQIALVPAGNRISAVLHNFDIDWHELKPEHQDWLNRHVVPIIRAGGSLRVEGRASRTGTELHNQTLSERRAREVLAFLRQRAGRDFQSVQTVTFGEHAAARGGWADGIEDAYYRSVVITAWLHPEPPPPPDDDEPPPPPDDDEPPPPPRRPPRPPPVGSRSFEIRIVSGRETGWLPLEHNFVFEIRDSVNDPRGLRSAIYNYRGQGIIPPIGPVNTRSNTRFVQGPWASFSTHRNATVSDFETRPGHAQVGFICTGSGRGPQGQQIDLVWVNLRFYPRRFLPVRFDSTMRGRFATPQLFTQVTVPTVGQLFLVRVRRGGR